MKRPDGRVIERVRLPVLLIEDIVREADRRGQSFEDVAGDLVAEALPEALGEAAEALLAEGRASLNLTRNTPGLESQPALPASTSDAPAIARRGVSDVSPSIVSSTRSVPARRLNEGSSSDGTRT
jgi:hypothetical protein